jgi:hypothetical protein
MQWWWCLKPGPHARAVPEAPQTLEKGAQFLAFLAAAAAGDGGGGCARLPNSGGWTGGLGASRRAPFAWKGTPSSGADGACASGGARRRDSAGTWRGDRETWRWSVVPALAPPRRLGVGLGSGPMGFGGPRLPGVRQRRSGLASRLSCRGDAVDAEAGGTTVESEADRAAAMSVAGVMEVTWICTIQVRPCGGQGGSVLDAFQFTADDCGWPLRVLLATIAMARLS